MSVIIFEFEVQEINNYLRTLHCQHIWRTIITRRLNFIAVISEIDTRISTSDIPE